jgi:serine/threonine-protein kinase ULK/ATG1
MREVRILGKGSCGTVTLVEDESTREQIALKIFPAGGQDVSELFFREIELLIRLSHPCVVRIVGYFLATRNSGAQIGTEFAVNGSLREALASSAAFLDDTGKAIVVAGVAVGMKFIRSQGLTHRDLKPANILLDGRGYPKISDLGNGRFFDLGLTMSSMIRTPGYMAREMSTDDDYSPAVDVCSFSLIVYELLVGNAAFPATLGLGILMEMAGSGVRPPLPGDMDDTVRGIHRRQRTISKFRFQFMFVRNISR